ncbi:DivIVA domain-containing protein [Streptomyces sp. BI20]|uniref:DivIVA domain-containing protein n=1 Tax=Streptomyces sp. BI20 TaxID=3403460 RepID=UPI003C70D31D
MFWFLLIALVVVVAAVTLAVVGGGEEAVLPEAEPERVADALPETRPVAAADIEDLRLPVAPRGYRMAEVDDVLARLGAELAERDARIAALEAAGARAGHPAPAAAPEPVDGIPAEWSAWERPETEGPEPGGGADPGGVDFGKRPGAGEDERDGGRFA